MKIIAGFRAGGELTNPPSPRIYHGEDSAVDPWETMPQHPDAVAGSAETKARSDDRKNPVGFGMACALHWKSEVVPAAMKGGELWATSGVRDVRGYEQTH